MSTFRRIWIRSALVAGLAILVGPIVQAQDEQTEQSPSDGVKKRTPTKFIRVKSDEYDSPIALQTGTVKYVLKDDDGSVKLEVFLEGVVHFADATYYRALNQRFKHYDAVLYELVAPPDKRVPVPDKSAEPNPLRTFQQLAADGLGFRHQIDEIDYTAANMVHSDLSPKEMAKAQRERGEDQLTMAADMMLHMMRKINRDRDGGATTGGADTADAPPQPFDLSMLTDPEGAVKLRRLMAAGFNDVDSLELPASQMALLVEDRNDRAMQVFQKQLDAGKRRIALFWGAAHMPDFEKRLILDYGLERANVTWRNAWDLREGAVRRTLLETILDKTINNAIKEVVRELQESSGEDQ